MCRTKVKKIHSHIPKGEGEGGSGFNKIWCSSFRNYKHAKQNIGTSIDSMLSSPETVNSAGGGALIPSVNAHAVLFYIVLR